MRITDSVSLRGVKKTPEGHLEAFARVSRTGIQNYLGAELGRPDLGIVRVYRGDDAVFNVDTLQTFAHIPLTLEHPPEMVTDENKDRFAVGETGDEVLRDGQFLKIGLRVTDAKAVEAVERGKRELSVGYEAEVDWTPGVTDSGEAYDARQTRIIANHLAITDSARAGHMARIGDSWGATPIFKKEGVMSTKTVVLGDSAVAVASEDAGKVEDFKAKMTRDAAAASAEIQALNAKLAEKDAEISGLKAAQITDAEIDRRVAARAKLISDAARIVPGFVADGKPDSEIRAEVVKKSGLFQITDSTSQSYIDAAFDILANGKIGGDDGIRAAILDAKPASGIGASWDRAVENLAQYKRK